MISFIKYFLIFLMVLILQIFVFDQVPQVVPFSRPVLFFAFLMVLPEVETVWLMVIGFMGGLILDMFYGTPGINASACLLLAYLKVPILRSFKNDEEENVKSSAHITYLGFTRYFFFILVISVIFHLVTEFLSVFSLMQAGQTLIRVCINSILSVSLIYIFEIILFYRKTTNL